MKKNKISFKEKIFLYKTLIQPLFEKTEIVDIEKLLPKEEIKILKQVAKKEKIPFTLLIEYLAYEEMVKDKLNIFKLNKNTLVKDNIFYLTDEIKLKVL